jgi:NADPH-dependent ferric siderophore reductase
MEIDAGDALRQVLAELDLPVGGAVVEATARVADWPEAKRVMMNAFALSRRAAVAEAPVIYVVHGDDLLGRRGAPSAMVATGLLSAARTAAIELSRKGATVNVVAVGNDTPPEVTARWVLALTDSSGPTGEVIRLDPGHLGKALP